MYINDKKDDWYMYMYVYMYIHIYLFIYLSVYLFIYLFASPPPYIPTFLVVCGR